MGIGSPALRPDGPAKAQGRFAYTADLWAPGMLWCVLVRSPRPHAQILGIDPGPAYAVAGVHAVITAADFAPGTAYGQIIADRPPLASGVVRFAGEPVAAVAAETPQAARRAAAALTVAYRDLEPVLEPELAFALPAVHPDGNILRHIELRHGRSDAVTATDVIVEGVYSLAPQNQANAATDAVLAVPVPPENSTELGGLELHTATQWPQADRDQTAECLGLPPNNLRLMPAGVGGSAGTREDVGLMACVGLLALRTGRPVKAVLDRAESLTAGGGRHGALLKYRHRADADGRLLGVEAQIFLDGGAYAGVSGQVLAQLAGCAAGPYMVPHVSVDAWAVRTNNPPAGSMRGPGATQVCFAYEAQMDKLAAALGTGPVELRLRNAISPGIMLPTAQVLPEPASVGALVRAVAEEPLPEVPAAAGLRRGIGYAVGMIPLLGGEGSDESSTATVRLDGNHVTVTCAAVEVGQGFVTLAQQIVHEVLGVPDAIVLPAGTGMPTAGPPGTGRHTWLTASAVEQAARDIRGKLLAPIAAQYGMTEALLHFKDGRIVSYDGLVDLPAAAALQGHQAVAVGAIGRAPRTQPLDDTGSGDAYAALAFAAYRVVVDVDPELGTVKVVDVTGAYDAGKVLDPRQARARVEGSAAMGIGLALVESPESFVLPDTGDVPPLRVALWHEEPQPGAPFGAKGLADAAVVPVPAAVAAAVRDATGREVNRLPIRPWDVTIY